MSKHISWSGTHPSLAILAEVAQERDAWQARAEAAETELASVRFAAQMPDDYEYGLSSWIHQYLYAAYIGAEIPRSVLERVATGALIFPEAPIYAEYKRLQGRVQELEAQLAAMDDDEREDVRHRAIINDVFGDDAKWGCDE